MRSRFVLLVLAILLIAGFAALNWNEVIRPAPLLFGPVVAEAPLGAILLGLLALAVVVFALSAASMRTHSLLESRHHYKELEAQRALADKAEASRFTELRQHMDSQLRDLRERDAIAATEMEKARVEQQREIRSQLEQMNRMLSARLNELEHRLESRLERMGVSRPAPGTGAPLVGHTPLRQEGAQPNPGPAHEHAMAQQERDHQAQMREEERRRDEQRLDERANAGANPNDRLTPNERPAEQSGWRRWF